MNGKHISINRPCSIAIFDCQGVQSIKFHPHPPKFHSNPFRIQKKKIIRKPIKHPLNSINIHQSPVDIHGKNMKKYYNPSYSHLQSINIHQSPMSTFIFRKKKYKNNLRNPRNAAASSSAPAPQPVVLLWIPVRWRPAWAAWCSENQREFLHEFRGFRKGILWNLIRCSWIFHHVFPSPSVTHRGLFYVLPCGQNFHCLSQVVFLP